MAVPADQLQAARDALTLAVANKTLRVKGPDGREIEYRSVQEMLDAITFLDEEIAKALGARANRTSVAQHRRGTLFPGGNAPGDLWWR